MKKMTLDEIKKSQLDILDFVASFCSSHDISYWLDFGTLLGAVRHQGYIPWDDDIDLGMLREDYDRFIHLFPELCCAQRYRLHCIENDSNFYLPYAKIVDTRTVLYEPDENGFKTGVNIDIFVFDNAPDDDRLAFEQFKRRDMYRSLYWLKTTSDFSATSFIKRVVKTAIHFSLCLVPNSYFIKKIVNNAKKYNNTETKRVGDFSGYYSVTCDKKVFDSFVEVEFEGKKYMAPVGYHEWLRVHYGDYMRLPQKEEQISHHNFVAYSLD